VYQKKVIAFTYAARWPVWPEAPHAMPYRYVTGADTLRLTRRPPLSSIACLAIPPPGVNYTAGTFVGALLVTMLPEWLRPVKEYLKLFYGIGVILLMVFMPMGLAGLITSIVKKKRKPITEVAEDESNS
jgi:branched-chain amino acid transport system permease protein